MATILSLASRLMNVERLTAPPPDNSEKEWLATLTTEEMIVLQAVAELCDHIHENTVRKQLTARELAWLTERSEASRLTREELAMLMLDASVGMMGSSKTHYRFKGNCRL
jgi:Cdc6-like AAA superfamily ATPase